MSSDYRVLVVEDDRVSRTAIAAILRSSHYDVTTVSDGREALALFEDRFFPIVITDWQMPEMTGLELCRELRSCDLPGYVFIVILTSRDTKSDLVVGLDAGADDYLTKPVSRSELVARLKTGARILDLEKSLLEANEEIRLLSVTDPLTRAYNRAYFMERAAEEVKRAQRYGRPLSIVLADIDHFKKVNDTYGHQVGDEVLKGFVARTSASLRVGVDWIVRYGGEEFLFVLPETPVEKAVVTAERLRSTLEAEPMSGGDEVLRVTASFGVAGVNVWPSDRSNVSAIIDSLVACADKHMYEAKEGGRNRVCGGLLA